LYVVAESRVCTDNSFPFPQLYPSQQVGTADAPTRLKLQTTRRVEPVGIDFTSNGTLIISNGWDWCLYACDPSNGEVELIAGRVLAYSDEESQTSCDGKALTEAHFHRQIGICVDPSLQCVWVVENLGKRIRCLTLNPAFFDIL
jgi:hypothetical protein